MTRVYNSEKKLSEETSAAMRCVVRKYNHFSRYAIAIKDCGNEITLTGDIGTLESTRIFNKRVNAMMNELTKLKQFVNNYER